MEKPKIQGKLYTASLKKQTNNGYEAQMCTKQHFKTEMVSNRDRGSFPHLRILSQHQIATSENPHWLQSAAPKSYQQSYGATFMVNSSFCLARLQILKRLKSALEVTSKEPEALHTRRAINSHHTE